MKTIKAGANSAPKKIGRGPNGLNLKTDLTAGSSYGGGGSKVSLRKGNTSKAPTRKKGF